MICTRSSLICLIVLTLTSLHVGLNVEAAPAGELKFSAYDGLPRPLLHEEDARRPWKAIVREDVEPSTQTPEFDPLVSTANFTSSLGYSTPQDPFVEHAGGFYGEQNYLQSTAEVWSWQLLPDSIIYKAYLAGVKESRLANFMTSGRSGVHGGNLLWEGILGARFGLIRYGSSTHVLPQGFQIDIEASGQVRLDSNRNVDVQATDYRVGLPITYGIGNWQFKTGYYHLSSHLGDEFQIERPAFTRLNYSRDVFLLGVGYNITPEVRLYAEMGYAFAHDVSEPLEFQFGVDYAPAYETGWGGAPFVALNGHLREEVNFGGNFVAQTGWAWRTHTGRLFRIGVQFFTGKSSQFSFYDFYEQQVALAMWHDW